MLVMYVFFYLIEVGFFVLGYLMFFCLYIQEYVVVFGEFQSWEQDMMKDFIKDMVMECDVEWRYCRLVFLLDWLFWVDYEEVSEIFMLEDGYSVVVMFEVMGVFIEVCLESFFVEVQVNI